jgi:hypothetical protein
MASRRSTLYETMADNDDNMRRRLAEFNDGVAMEN